MLPRLSLMGTLLTLFSSISVYAQVSTITTVTTGTNSVTSTPTLTGTAVSVETSEPGPDGTGQVDIFLSPDLQSALQDTIDNQCNTLSESDCVVAVYKILASAPLDSSSNLQGRGSDWIEAIPIIGWGPLMYDAFNQPPATKLTISNHYQFENEQLAKAPSATVLVLEIPAVTATIPVEPAMTTETGSVPVQNYAILPTSSPTLDDKVGDIITRQPERQAFEARMASNGIVLTRVLSDSNIDLWTADLNPIQLAAVKIDPLITWVVPNFDVQRDDDRGTYSEGSRIRRGRSRRSHGGSVRKQRDTVNMDRAIRNANMTKRATNTPGWTTQGNAGFDLHALSSLDDVPINSGDYDYLSSAGGNSIVYIIESTPYLIRHSEIARPLDQVDGWIQPNRNTRNPLALYPARILPGQEHGTMVLSKLLGKTVGVARNVGVVLVQNTYNKLADFTSFWRSVVEDAIDKKRLNPGKNVIINMSGTTYWTLKDYNSWNGALRDTLMPLVAAEIPLVLSAGNSVDQQGVPNAAGFVRSEQEVTRNNPTLYTLVAGHTDQNGSPLVSPDRYANVWAIGKDVMVADPSTLDKLMPTLGSSFTAPQTSGLLAMFLEDPKLKLYWAAALSTPQASLSLLLQTSKIRGGSQQPSDARPLAYNLAQDSVCDATPPVDPPVVQRDFSGPSSCVQLNPTATSIVWPSQSPSATSSTSTPSATPDPTSSGSLPVITDGSNGGTCGNDKRVGPVGINSKPIDKNTLQQCLLNLDTSKWLDDSVGDASDCDGMVSFQSASKSWNSPADCHNACKNCLSQSIEDGVNQIWCDAWAGSAHCWEGYVITPPPLVTDGSPYNDDNSGASEQTIVASGYDGINGKYIDEYAVQDCIRNMDASNWLVDDTVYDCGDMLHFDMYSVTGWSSPSDCWNAIKNCLSDAVNAGASEAFCDTWAAFAHCRGGFYPR